MSVDTENDVDLDDLKAVRTNFGTSGDAHNVPEPSSLAWVSAILLTIMVRRIEVR